MLAMYDFVAMFPSNKLLNAGLWVLVLVILVLYLAKRSARKTRLKH